MSSFELGISQGRRGLWQRSSQRPRAPWRRGTWSRVEVATALQARRPELLRSLSARGDVRGLSETVLEEVVDDAIGVVVMMRRPISSEGHLMGAFWTTARILLRQHREGRHRVRIGSRSRVGLETVAGWVASDELGAVRIGGGERPRLRFDPDRVAECLKRAASGPPSPAARPTRVRRSARIRGDSSRLAFRADPELSSSHRNRWPDDGAMPPGRGVEGGASTR